MRTPWEEGADDFGLRVSNCSKRPRCPLPKWASIQPKFCGENVSKNTVYLLCLLLSVVQYKRVKFLYKFRPKYIMLQVFSALSPIFLTSPNTSILVFPASQKRKMCSLMLKIQQKWQDCTSVSLFFFLSGFYTVFSSLGRITTDYYFYQQRVAKLCLSVHHRMAKLSIDHFFYLWTYQWKHDLFTNMGAISAF